MESIKLPSNVIKVPKRKEISEDLFRKETIQTILLLVDKKERAKYEKMFEALEKKLLSEIRQQETGTDKLSSSQKISQAFLALVLNFLKKIEENITNCALRPLVNLERLRV